MKIAIVDPASFVLPYDYYYIHELALLGYEIDFFCSETTYNSEYLDFLKNTKNVRCYVYNVSASCTNRLNAIFNYSKMLIDVARNRNCAYIHFQFNIFLPLEIFFFIIFRHRLIVTVHNAFPHNGKKKKNIALWVQKILAVEIIFPSNHTKNEFIGLYGPPRPNRRYSIVQHGITPLSPNHLGTPVTPNNTPSDKLIFWGTIKPYKGVDVFCLLAKSPLFLNWEFKVYGKWDTDLFPLKFQLEAYNVAVVDRFLEPQELEEIFKSNNIFILPYKHASQSGVLYTLLYYQKFFICSDTGDIADFLRRYDMDYLIFKNPVPEDIHTCLENLKINIDHVTQQLSLAKHDYAWHTLMRNHSEIYPETHTS